jgi:hypothetical protein
VPTQTPLQFYGPHCEKERCLESSFVGTSKYLLIVLQIEISQNLTPLALDLALDSSTRV